MLSYQRVNGNHPENTIPLIFLHGLLGERQNWNTQAKYFSRHAPVITVDLRNHGDSPHVKGMSYRQMAEDLLALCQHLSLPRIDLCGHSMGGKVAMYLALHHAERIRKLVIVDIAPVNYPLWHQALLQALLALPVERMKTRREADTLLAETVDDVFERAFLLKNLVRTESGFRWQCNLPEIARHYVKIAHFPATERDFSNSALFIRGADSPYISAKDEPVINRYFPRATIQTIDKAGHLPHIQQATLFARQLETFLLKDNHLNHPEG